jgi:hypothetical protein
MTQTAMQAGGDRGLAGKPSTAERRRHWRRKGVVPALVQPHSAVRILRDGELSEALHRAAQFERDAANVQRRRADRYEALIVLPAPVRAARAAPRPPSAA